MKTPPNSPAEFIQNRSDLADESAGERDSAPTVVVCVGDSLTHGSISSNYVENLSSRFEAGETEFVNAGINGDLAFDVLQRIDHVIACDPDIVTVLIGTNDVNALTSKRNLRIYRRNQKLTRPPDESSYRANLRAIADRLKIETSATIVLLSIPPVGEDPDHPAFQRSVLYGKIARSIARETDVDFIPLGETLRAYLQSNPRPSPPNDSHALGAVITLMIRRFVMKQSYAHISQSNGHTLLTDHLHLNDTAGGVVADLIEAYIRTRRATSP